MVGEARTSTSYTNSVDPSISQQGGYRQSAAVFNLTEFFLIAYIVLYNGHAIDLAHYLVDLLIVTNPVCHYHSKDSTWQCSTGALSSRLFYSLSIIPSTQTGVLFCC